MISKQGRACIGDFGLSQKLDYNENSESSDLVSDAWRFGGNLRWKAPELLRDARRTTQSDVFAFGRVIIEVGCFRWPTVTYIFLLIL